MNLSECLFNLFCKVVKRYKGLLARYAANENAGVVFDITGTDFETERNTLHLILCILPTGGVIAVVELYTQGLRKFCLDFGCLFKNAFLVLCNGDDNNLNGSYARGENETVVVTVCHNDGTDGTGGYAPRCLVGIFERVVTRGELDVKCLCKAIAKVVGGTALQSHTVVHHRLNGVGLFSACKLFLFGLSAGVSGDSKSLCIEVLINLEHLEGFLSCFFLGLVHGVTLLPEEFCGTQEGTGGLFPTNNVAPLVIELGQIAIGLNDVAEMLAEECFGCGANDQSLGELILTANGNDSTFGSEALNVILFLLQKRFGNEHGHINVLVTECLEARVEILLNVLPNSVAVGAEDHAALNAGVVSQLGFFYYVCVPLTEIHVHRCDLVNHFFIILCHNTKPHLSPKRGHNSTL